MQRLHTTIRVPITPTISNQLQPATATVRSSISDKAMVSGACARPSTEGGSVSDKRSFRGTRSFARTPRFRTRASTARTVPIPACW